MLGFFILQVPNFERLLRAIYAPQNIYCVHVDKKSEASVFSTIKAITDCFPNVFIASQTVDVVYSAWPRVQADLNCMADLYNASTKWKYFINLCGQDFPLKTNLEIVRMLRSLKGGNSLESEKMPEEKKWRVKNSYNIVDGKLQVFLLQIFIILPNSRITLLKLYVQIDFSDVTNHTNSPFQLSQGAGKAKEPPPFNLPIMSGNAYIVVNRGYIRSVLNDNRVLALIEWAKDTYSPDEFLWATVQRMPSIPGSRWPSRKHDMTDIIAIARLVKWQWHEGSQDSLEAVYPECQGNHVRAVCVYGVGDLQWMLKQHHLFANKFDTDTDPIAVYCLEKYLRQKALAGLH